MKVTIRNRRTGQFLTEAGAWVSSGLQAKDFRDTAPAEQHTAQLALPDVDIYYIFDDPRLNHWSRRRREIA
jgi:hypothetical protein